MLHQDSDLGLADANLEVIWTNPVLTRQWLYSPWRNSISKSTKKIDTLEPYICLPEKCLLVILNYLFIKKSIFRDMTKRRRRRRKEKEKTEKRLLKRPQAS